MAVTHLPCRPRNFGAAAAEEKACGKLTGGWRSHSHGGARSLVAVLVALRAVIAAHVDTHGHHQASSAVAWLLPCTANARNSQLEHQSHDGQPRKGTRRAWVKTAANGCGMYMLFGMIDFASMLAPRPRACSRQAFLHTTTRVHDSPHGYSKLPGNINAGAQAAAQ